MYSRAILGKVNMTMFIFTQYFFWDYSAEVLNVTICE